VAIDFKTIVVPIDFSACSRMALECAMKLVSDHGRILLCHVIDDVPLTYGYVGATYEVSDLQSHLDQKVKEELDSVVPERTGTGNVEARILHGPPSREIVDLVRAELADLVVMGTHGRSGLGHLLLGSVAEKVVRSSPSPVMVVPEESCEEASA
jgi:nucleotide-binding universal stress UspA family protein